MSANLELARSINADWERGDFRQGAWFSDEVDFVSVEGPNPRRKAPARPPLAIGPVPSNVSRRSCRNPA
jgi:hypothetical protein